VGEPTGQDPHGFTDLPAEGAWRLLGAHEGHELVRFSTDDGGVVLQGASVGVEDGVPWHIRYRIEVSAELWRVRRAELTDHAGTRLDIRIEEPGSWVVNGKHRADLDGCLDLDLEASVVTNTLPVHRLALSVGQQGESAAGYVRTGGLRLERLDQTYRRLPDRDGRLVFDYASPRFDYRDTLLFGADGLAVDYPGIGVRIPLTTSGPRDLQDPDVCPQTLIR